MLTRHITIILALVVAIATAKQAQADDVARQLTGRGYALLIGVSAYSDTRWPPLPSVRREISELQSGLAPHFARVATLMDPTINDLRASLTNLFQNIGSDTS
jgi:hypothetical protein